MLEQTPGRAAFAEAVKQALEDLYNPTALRGSPLLAQLGLAERHNPVGALRQELTDAVGRLRPDPKAPSHSDSRRLHSLLVYRFIEGASQKQVAADLGLSTRQIRREEVRAVEALADHLWERFRLNAVAPPPADSAAPEAPPRSEGRELQWLASSVLPAACDIGRELAGAVNTARTLCEGQSNRLVVSIAPDLPLVAGDPLLVRQALLNLLAASCSAAAGGLVRASVAVSGESQVLAVISAERAAPDSPARQQQLLDQVCSTQDLANLIGARVTLEMNEAGFTARLLLPQLARRVVFLIDDNADAHRLVERYLAESPYRVVGTRDPTEAVPLSVSIAPHAILLDVMLPGIDGWELLGRLRAHPALIETPVVICTFLPQEPLALSLGAADFLRKPFSREALLESLGRFETLPGKTPPAAP